MFHSKRYKEEIGSVDVLTTTFVQARGELDVSMKVLSYIVKPEFVTLRDFLIGVYDEGSKEVRLYDYFLFLESNLSNFSEMEKWGYNFYTADNLVAIVADWEEKHRYYQKLN